MSAESPISPTTPIHTYSPGTLIYEVNLSIPREKAEDYVEWLRGFTKACYQFWYFANLIAQFSNPNASFYPTNESNNIEQVQRIPGFLSSMVFRQPKPYGLHWLSEEGDAKTYITVHYVIESQAHLQAYLENEQPKVAAAEQDRFEFLVTSRRTLSVVF
ncbi:hypothetical protein BGX27_006905 [Mortierella sp. AM989]|nr:hypothetical protein BGX27_006905 [Mortierella sp. AM989]